MRPLARYVGGFNVVVFTRRSDLVGVPISLGAVSAVEARVSDAVAPARYVGGFNVVVFTPRVGPRRRPDLARRGQRRGGARV